MLRNVGAVILGMIVGMAVNMALVMLNTYVLFPMPAGLEMSDAAGFNAYIATLPSSAFILVLAAHLGQSFFGGWAAARVCASHPMRIAMIVGVLSLVGGILNMMSIKGPDWLYVELPLYLIVAWLAGRIEVNRRAKLEM